MRKIISILLAVFILISCSNLCIFVNAAEIDGNVATSVQPREIMSLSKTVVLRYGTNSVTCTIPYVVSTDLSNVSSFRIASYSNPRFVSKDGWHSVDTSSFTITNAQYFDNAQKVVLTISYEASIGAGYQTYTGSATITVPNYSG